MSDLYELIKEKSAIIFDVDDVVLFNLYRNQSDMFDRIEEACSSPGFSESRMNVNHTCKHDKLHIDEIYNKMNKAYFYLKEKELEIKDLSNKINPEIKSIISITSDLNIPIYFYIKNYKDSDNIEELLNKNFNNLQYKIYFESQEKSIDKLCAEIAYDTSTKLSDILYIRNNKLTSEFNKEPFSVYIYESLFRKYGQNLNSSYFAVLNKYTKDDMLIPLLQSNIALYTAKEKHKSEWTLFGYKYIGILLYEYTQYVGKIANNLNIKKIFFSSEGGHCLKYAFEKLFPNIQSKIINIPKRTILLSSISTTEDISTILLKNLKDEVTFSSWIELLCPNKSEELYNNYINIFPDQERIISSDEDYSCLRDFISENDKLIFSKVEKEKLNLENYLNNIGLLDESVAILDISKNSDLLCGLKSKYQNTNITKDITVFFWDFNPSLLLKYSLLNQMNKQEYEGKSKNIYLQQILEFSLSYFDYSSESLNSNNNIISIRSKILDGAKDCIDDLHDIDEKFPVSEKQIAIMAVCEYFENYIDKKDIYLLESIYTGDSNSHNENRPLFKQGKPVIGIVNPWPEDVSAEAEVITRMKRTAEENNIDCVLIDSFGHILTDSQKPTKKFVKEEDLSFVITTHYECAKILNTFYYNPLWNPPEIPLNLSDYTPRVTNYFMTNDDFLIYDNGGMSNYLRAILMNSPKTLDGASALTASFPISAAMPPKLDNPIMFYCGMNWEIMFGTEGRHDGLFKLLDNTGKIKYYGPERVEAWGGLKPWEGYRCYEGMIPFDGFSIVEKINECGVCLVLSSDTHRRAGSATNRLYEACAAGAVMISDDNEFVTENFKDAALFIKFNKNDPQDTYNQIMEKYNWIIKHPDEALNLARRAQDIYLKKYSLDKQLNQIIKNHPSRVEQVSKDFYAKTQNEKVLVTFVLDTQKFKDAKKMLDIVFKNLHGQIYSNIELAIATDKILNDDIQDYSNKKCASAHIVSMNLFDTKGIRAMTDGEAIRMLQNEITHDYFINTSANEIWFYDHITSLVRSITENNSMGAYSGASFEGSDGCRRINFFDVLNTNHLYHMTSPERQLVAGQFLFHKNSHRFLPDYLFSNIDGKEHIAYAGIIKYRNGEKISFTKRMSLCFSDKYEDMRCNILNETMQQRFIRDLIRFYIPEQVNETKIVNNISTSDTNRDSVSNLFLYLPIKSYIQLRYYRFRMRGKSPDSKIFKKYAKKYDDLYQKYKQYWGI